MSVNQMNEYKSLRLEIIDHERNATIYLNLGTNNKGSGNLEIGFTEVSS